ncbi:MAG: hypothetical protein NVSMB47_02840 [Polyangiales bacterium]
MTELDESAPDAPSAEEPAPPAPPKPAARAAGERRGKEPVMPTPIALPFGPRPSLRPMLLALATVLVIAGVLLFKGIRTLGIWDPHELVLADLGCHRAASSGAFDLAKCGLDPSTKHTDARSIVMVQTVAWGFRLFGVSEAAGRIPLALWALLGVLAATLAVGRLVDARAGLFTGIALATMPMYIVQGRLMLGDGATMGAFALALSGLAVAAFDRGDDGAPTSWGQRAPWALAGAIGLAACIGARGFAVGATPAAAVGLAWLVRTANVERSTDARAPLATLCGAALALAALVAGMKLAGLEANRGGFNPWSTRAMIAAALLGAASLAWIRGTGSERAERAIVGAALAVGLLGRSEGVTASFLSDDGHFVAAVGATAQTARKFPTFDLLVRQIAHGLCPWSCFVPFALGRSLARPSVESGGAARREIDLRMAAMLAAAFCYGVETMIAPKFGLAPFAGPVALAIVIGLCLRDLERAPAGSLAVAIGTAVLVFLVFNDFTFEDLSKTPVELATAPIVEPYALYGVSIPEELRLKLRLIVAVAGAAFLLPIFFVWVDEDPRPGWTPFARLRKPIDATLAAWRHPYQGLLLLLLASFEACVAVLGLLAFKKGLRRMIPQLQALSIQQRDLLVNLWWMIPVGIVAGYCGYVAFLYGRDAFRALRRQRVATIAIGGLVAGGIWSFGIMPAVANQFSPKGLFSTYRTLGKGQPIALLGVNARTAAYDLDNAQPTVLADPKASYEWLTKDDGQRKWLALRSEHLAELNKLWREKASPRTNLPIIDGRSAQVLLASSLLEGHINESPLEKMILAESPTATSDCDKHACAPTHPLDCDIDGKLRCVGWELTDDKGRILTSVTSGEKVQLRLIDRVTAKVSGGWQIFIHVEQPGTATARKTWDHVPLQSKYPMDDWLPGDVIVDDSEFNLEPNMRSGAPIMLLTGFFSGTSRLPLVSGPDAGPEQEGLRLVLGTVPVR